MRGLVATAAFATALIVSACFSADHRVERGTTVAIQSTTTIAHSPVATRQDMPTPTDVWTTLLQTTPYPFSTPLPPPTPTILDGAYVKLEPNVGTPVPCRRCPDYAPEGGIWKLHLDGGIFRIAHEVTGWRSLGSFVVSGDRFTLFNDPNCIDEVGTYTWTLDEGELTLKIVDDDCAIRLRAKNLSSLPWASCQPPSLEAAISDHWLKPPGC